MKAIVYQKFGTADVLQTVEEPKPTIQADQVLVKVKGFSINPMDWKIRKGEMKIMSSKLLLASPKTNIEVSWEHESLNRACGLTLIRN